MSMFEKPLTQIPFNLKMARHIKHEIIKGEIRTLEFRKVELLIFRAKGDFPIVGLVTVGDQEVAMQWTLKGKRDLRDNVTTGNDLILLVPDEEGGAS